MPESARPTICVVDDDEDIRESLRFLFEEAGYSVEEAEDGDQALALLRADTMPRVVLLDRMMARLDGIETLRRFSAEPADAQRRTVILFMSARNDPPAQPDADLIARHTFATVFKPFHLDDLLATVARAGDLLTWRHAEA
ncbi:MAG TPA: response regulator [Ktedonobacterales bacterium]|nr:response regulator [Ktedonobacterales bacterium]